MTPLSDNQLLKQIQDHIEKNSGKKDTHAIALALGIKERKVKKLLEKHGIERKPPTKPAEKRSPVETTQIQRPPIKKWIVLCSMLFIIFSGFLIYANSINGKFLWDDEILIQDNKEIWSWSNLPRLFVENIGTGAGRDYNFYRPIHMLTIMANYSMFKNDVRGYHLTNIIIHIFAALCIYTLVNLLFYNNTLSLLTALFWVIHPVHTEVVDYISGRFDCLSAFFMLLCMVLYIKNNRSVLSTYFLVPACSILAILSKENALILPALILLYHYMFDGFKLKRFLPLIAIIIIYIILRLTVLYFPDPSGQTPTTLLERIPGFLVAVTNYASILVLPFNLHMEHGDMLFKLANPKALIGTFILTLLVLTAISSRKSNKLVTFGIGWFLLCLFPESNLYRINAYMNEHWLYLPSFGFFLILANYLSLLIEKDKLKIIGMIIFAGLFSYFSFLTIKQNDYWKDPVSFYQRTLKFAPFSSRLLNNLARQYELSGRYKEAVDLYKRAIKINPNYAEAYNNLGVALADEGKNDQAIDAYKMAIRIDPNFVGAFANLGNSLNKAGKSDEAIDTIQTAINMKPDSSAYNNLAMVYRDKKEYAKAVEWLQKAVAMDPDSIVINFNLGNTYAAMGMAREAITAYSKVIQLKPNSAYAYNNRGFLLKGLGKNEEAISDFEAAIRIDPKMPQAYANLVLTYLNMGNISKAKEAYNNALQADPANAANYSKLLDDINRLQSL